MVGRTVACSLWVYGHRFAQSVVRSFKALRYGRGKQTVTVTYKCHLSAVTSKFVFSFRYFFISSVRSESRCPPGTSTNHDGKEVHLLFSHATLNLFRGFQKFFKCWALRYSVSVFITVSFSLLLLLGKRIGNCCFKYFVFANRSWCFFHQVSQRLVGVIEFLFLSCLLLRIGYFFPHLLQDIL